MHVVPASGHLELRLAAELPDLRPPAVLLQRLAEALAGETVLLLCGDLRPLGFGAYDGQLCLVTPTRVVLATGTQRPGPEGSFGVEQWEREVAPLPGFTGVPQPQPGAFDV